MPPLTRSRIDLLDLLGAYAHTFGAYLIDQGISVDLFSATLVIVTRGASVTMRLGTCLQYTLTMYRYAPIYRVICPQNPSAGVY